MPDHAELLTLANKAESLGSEFDEALRELRRRIAEHTVDNDPITPEEAGPILLPLAYIRHDYESLQLREAIDGIVTLATGADRMIGDGWEGLYEEAETRVDA